ncbi:DUF4326 domain-containing protein [Nonomuraea wenchangensis]|uniref:DUF4326 domain-containing protein n=1 Tax=Nonomuraea wenchangensis TaxID=568860 RepID=A0A1I0LU95_9ACTN|nr:DUF4326 domain-containing protein [Nonomuraea wenchangensis]SEU46857.1 protein of unknown function [Nonomuraea wenchangensis]
MGRRVKVSGDLFHGQVPAGAVYIGRPAPSLPGSPFANPYSVKTYGLENALARYRKHLAEHPELVERAIEEIGDRDVACWCKPDARCHGDILLAAMAARR